MKHDDVKSSNIKSVGYDEKEKTLEVIFSNGSHYSYSGVDAEAYKSFVGAESIGKHFSTNIKSKYKFKKVNKDGHANRK